MAVLQGARLRTDTLPAGHIEDRRLQAVATAPATTGAPSRVRPTGLLMAAIVAATMLGLVYLTQTLGGNATSTEIKLLEGKKVQLQTQIGRDAILVIKATDDDIVRTEARRLKLKKLGEGIVLQAP